MANNPDKLWRFYQWKSEFAKDHTEQKWKKRKSSSLPIHSSSLPIHYPQRAVSVTCLIRSSGFKASSGLRTTGVPSIISYVASHLTSLSLFHWHSFKYTSSFTVNLSFSLLRGHMRLGVIYLQNFPPKA